MRFKAFKKLIPVPLLLTISLLAVVCVAPAAASPIFAVSSLGTMGGWASGAAAVNSSGQANDESFHFGMSVEVIHARVYGVRVNPFLFSHQSSPL